MKLTVKILLVICLFTSIAFADGEMGTGGKTCPPQTACLDGEMGTGGLTVDDQNQNDSMLSFIQKYLISIFE